MGIFVNFHQIVGKNFHTGNILDYFVTFILGFGISAHKIDYFWGSETV